MLRSTVTGTGGEIVESIQLFAYLIAQANSFASARSCYQRRSIKKVVLKNFTKFTGKHLC